MDAKYAALNQNMANTSTSVLSQLKVVIWKNFIIRKHHWFLSLCEIAIPIVLFVLIAYARSKIGGLGKYNVTTPTYRTEDSSQFFYNHRLDDETKIFYTPTNEFTDELIHKVQLKFQPNIEAIKGFGSESDLVAHYETFARNETIMAVVFKNVPRSEIPRHFDYVIRPFEKYVDWDTQSLYYSKQQYASNYSYCNGSKQLCARVEQRKSGTL